MNKEELEKLKNAFNNLETNNKIKHKKFFGLNEGYTTPLIASIGTLCCASLIILPLYVCDLIFSFNISPLLKLLSTVTIAMITFHCFGLLWGYIENAFNYLENLKIADKSQIKNTEKLFKKLIEQQNVFRGEIIDMAGEFMTINHENILQKDLLTLNKILHSINENENKAEEEVSFLDFVEKMKVNDINILNDICKLRKTHE